MCFRSRASEASSRHRAGAAELPRAWSSARTSRRIASMFNVMLIPLAPSYLVVLPSAPPVLEEPHRRTAAMPPRPRSRDWPCRHPDQRELRQRILRSTRPPTRDRKSVVSGKGGAVRVDLGGSGIIKKKKRQK